MLKKPFQMVKFLEGKFLTRHTRTLLDKCFPRQPESAGCCPPGLPRTAKATPLVNNWLFSAENNGGRYWTRTSDPYDVNTHPYTLLSMTQHSIVLTFAL